jgi:hypothetical protein
VVSKSSSARNLTITVRPTTSRVPSQSHWPQGCGVMHHVAIPAARVGHGESLAHGALATSPLAFLRPPRANRQHKPSIVIQQFQMTLLLYSSSTAVYERAWRADIFWPNGSQFRAEGEQVGCANKQADKKCNKREEMDAFRNPEWTLFWTAIFRDEWYF